MKAYGDIPAEHLNLIDELIDLERWFDENGDLVSSEIAAKGFVAMAHDYYHLEIEEEGDRLLTRTEKVFPGYFKTAIHDHIKKDKDFRYLVENLVVSLGIDLMKKYGFKYGALYS